MVLESDPPAEASRELARAGAIGLLAPPGRVTGARRWKGRGRWYSEARRQAIARDGPGCAVCGALDVPLDLDHVLPVADFPELEWDLGNVQLLCKIDHKAKSARETRERVRRAVEIGRGGAAGALSRKW